MNADLFGNRGAAPFWPMAYDMDLNPRTCTAKETIAVSVIIPSFNSRHTIEPCLESLENQTTQHDYEIIVVDSSEDSTAQIIALNYPDVRLYHFRKRLYPGDARNTGAARAKSSLLAFTDSDCIVDQNWIDRIIEAHKDPFPLIGGVIDNGNPGSYVGWAHYFSKLSQWMPNTPSGRMVIVPTGCMTVKRWAFEKYGPFAEGIYSEDTLFNWRLGNGEGKPLFISTIVVKHINQRHMLQFLRKQIAHGHSFAAVRVFENRLSCFHRFVFVSLSPLLPLVLFYRITKRVVQRKRYLKQFLLSSPILFLDLMGWSWGEFCGYLSSPAKLSEAMRSEGPGASETVPHKEE